MSGRRHRQWQWQVLIAWIMNHILTPILAIIITIVLYSGITWVFDWPRVDDGIVWLVVAYVILLVAYVVLEFFRVYLLKPPE